MSQVQIFTGNVEELRYIAEAWKIEAGGFGIQISIDEHLKDLRSLTDSPDKALLVLYSTKPIGYMGITKFKSPLGNEFFANEHYWYIIPSMRGSMGAMRLMLAAQQWAKQNNCDYLLMSASRLAGHMHDKICKLYEKLDFSHFETTYIKKMAGV